MSLKPFNGDGEMKSPGSRLVDQVTRVPLVNAVIFPLPASLPGRQKVWAG